MSGNEGSVTHDFVDTSFRVVIALQDPGFLNLRVASSSTTASTERGCRGFYGSLRTPRLVMLGLRRLKEFENADTPPKTVRAEESCLRQL